MAAKKRHDRMTPWLWLIVGGLMATAAVVLLVGLAGMEGNSLRATSYVPPYTPPPTPVPEEEFDDAYDPVLDCINNQCVPMFDACVNLWDNIEQKCRSWGWESEDCYELRQYGIDNCNDSQMECAQGCKRAQES